VRGSKRTREKLWTAKDGRGGAGIRRGSNTAANSRKSALITLGRWLAGDVQAYWAAHSWREGRRRRKFAGVTVARGGKETLETVDQTKRGDERTSSEAWAAHHFNERQKEGLKKQNHFRHKESSISRGNINDSDCLRRKRITGEY